MNEKAKRHQIDLKQSLRKQLPQNQSKEVQ